MSYKLSLIISMIFVVYFSVFAADLLIIQNAYTLLDSKSINISYYLSRTGDVSNDSINYIERWYDVEFTLKSSSRPAFGDDIIYNLSTSVKTLTMGNSVEIAIRRMTVVGYFN